MSSTDSDTSRGEAPAADPGGSCRREAAAAYWRANIILVASLMFGWAFLSFGCGIFLSEWLDHWNLPGSSMPLGFFMAQQGAIYGFLLLIALYIWRMNTLDRKFRQSSATGEEEAAASGGGPAGGH